MEDERIIEIETERLRTFRNHPFKVNDDAEMTQLVQSIKHYGILNPSCDLQLQRGQAFNCFPDEGREYRALTETLSLSSDPRKDGLVKCRTGEDTDETVYNNWYKAVYVPIGADS